MTDQANKKNKLNRVELDGNVFLGETRLVKTKHFISLPLNFCGPTGRVLKCEKNHIAKHLATSD